jgi:RHS repeat-associated protein
MDPRGNRLAMFHNGVQTPYTYGDNNELTDAGGTGWDYDHFGNTVSMGAYDLTYDFESHVLTISAIVGASDIHEYDGDGRRMRSKLNGSSVWNHFVHDELTENILIEYQVPVNPNAKSLYTWGIGLISSTQVAVSEKRWFHFDGLGSTRALTDFDENITDTYEFSAFGALESSTGSSVNPFRYVGQWGYYDDGARSSQYGLLLLGVRYYERNVGRFLAWDLVQDVNRYSYCENDPTNATDPYGLRPVYGKYCGPQIVPGRGIAIDELDECCRKHDKCFDRHKCTAFNQWLYRDCWMCNINLCECAKKAKCTVSVLKTGNNYFLSPCEAMKATVIAYACSFESPAYLIILGKKGVPRCHGGEY